MCDTARCVDTARPSGPLASCPRGDDDERRCNPINAYRRFSVTTAADILIVDDDAEFRETLRTRLSRSAYDVAEAADGRQALSAAAARSFDVAVFDVQMPGMDGVELLRRFKREYGECEVVLLTGKATIETAVEAMKLGAYDYLQKPFPLKELELVVAKALERRRLRSENERLKTLLVRSQPNEEIVGDSPPMRELHRLIDKAAPSDRPVLILGESGTGKELVARALHQRSPRSNTVMVTVNCAALPETLLESEFFGHEKGSFTGATATKQGLFEAADGGTLFIDEIGELPLVLQAKLLRTLEDGSFRRVGSVQSRRAHVRVIAATNRELVHEVAEKRFREDLYYRLNVLTLRLPPLRERMEDVPALVCRFLGTEWDIEPQAMAAIERYRWPGNVRQLINAIERAKILGEDGIVRWIDLPEEVIGLRSESVGADDACVASATGFDDLDSIQRSKVVEILRREGGNKSRAANVLGIARRKLYRLLEKHGIQDSEIERSGDEGES